MKEHKLLEAGCEVVETNRGRKAFFKDGAILAVECTKCKEIKSEKEFAKESRHKFKKQGRCNECFSKYNKENKTKIAETKRKYRRKNRDKLTEYKRKYYRENKEQIAKNNKEWAVKNRSKVAEYKRKWREENRERLRKKWQEYYRENREVIIERSRKWVKDNPEKRLKYSRKHYRENKERYVENRRKWNKNNPNHNRLLNQRYEALKRSLPHTETVEQRNETREYFDDSCALTKEKGDIHFDHVIPLSSGHGGTVHGNIIPLRADLNISKSNHNIFDWFADNRERFELSQRKFDELIEYLADINEMTVEEYRDYVYWCHDNPRTVDEIIEERAEA